MSTLDFYVGGMLRCCLQTIRRYAGPEAPGTRLTCPVCNAEVQIVALDTHELVWRWVDSARNDTAPGH